MVEDIVINIVGASLIAYSLSIVVSLIVRKSYSASIRYGLALVSLASVLQLTAALIVLFSGLSLNFYNVFYIDRFNSIFIAMISLAGFTASLYGINYMEIYREIGGSSVFSMMLALFLSSMTMLCMARNLLLFVFFWEIMTLSSIILIGWEYNKRAVVRATKQYLYTMLLLNSLPLIIASAILWSSYGVTDFFKLKEIVSMSSPKLAWILSLSLLYIVFTSKAGLYPLHYWLPDAHPAAPSNISSLLSGVMIKMGVYGLFGIMFRFLSAPQVFYYVLIVQGLLSIFWGSIKAIGEDHAKRLLAYSSISQIGYIVVPLGLSILSYSISPILSTVLLAAGLAYMFAHSMFKTLLFLTSGCYLYLFNTADLNEIKGLGSTNKILLFSIIVGAFSLAGLPPLMGFLAKLSIYASTLLGGELVYGIIAFLLIALSPLTILYSVKYMIPAIRIGENSNARKIGGAMNLGMIITALALIVLGVYSILGVFLNAANVFYRSETTMSTATGFYYSIPPYAYYFPLLIALSIASGIILAYIDRGHDVRIGGVWTTGYIIPQAYHRIRPRYIYQELTSIFKPLTVFSHEVYNCIVWRIPVGITNSGIANKITSFFDKLNEWNAQKIRNFAEKYSRLREFKLDELAGSSITALIKVFSYIARLIIVSPIALFTIAVLILSIIILVLLIVFGGW